MARLDAALDDPTIGYECGTSVLHLREEIDGHTCVLLRRFDEDEMWEIVTAFPLPGDPGVVINPPPAEPYPACQVASAMIGFVASLPGFGRDEPGHARLWVAATLAEVGEPYEAAIWALEMCVEHDVAFPEELYATLLAMANYEYFDATYTGAPFSKLVAAEWRRHHPATWQ
ncbi:hypothetical protein [Tsukamurella spumae]|uniref:Uncharacterized protein n=1 Tax=Tsukamurella spumae TaxID=44753 RepID=A0A846WX73_9ACTN|nr:hypothetical protein [Tsukamurella spumae]NKY16875.1 hypothetical protein [Tsukamurella spumae]